MSNKENSSYASSGNAKNRREDVGWKYNYLADEKDTNVVTCMFCGKVTRGGINRAKQHQLGNSRNATACKKVTEDARRELLEALNTKKIRRDDAFQPPYNLEDYGFGNDIDEDGVEEVNPPPNRKESSGGSVCTKGKTLQGPSGFKGPMDLYTRSKKQGEGSKMKQTSMHEACDKELRARTNQVIARFFYQCGIAFNVARTNIFKEMIETVGRHGPHLKPPSYHELRVPLLKKELELTNDILKGHKAEWEMFGYSIMSDGWTDRKGRTLINFLVNCSLGTMFVESVDASSYVKTGEKIFELFDAFVDRIGEKNIVQVITDNGSNFKLAGEMLMLKRKSLFWTPCVAHCLDLILEDIGKIRKVQTTLKRGVSLVGYIYNHSGVLNMMRKFNGNKELVRFGVTRFATSFLCLQSLFKQKQSLRTMFTSEEWGRSRWSKEAKGKNACQTVLITSFWRNVTVILKVMGPLVRVLRLVDGDKKPAMGYIYEAMDKAKEAIQKEFKGNEDKYNEIFKIIDTRWECQLHHPLHVAGHFLNPEYFYKDPSIQYDMEIIGGLYKCVEKLLPEHLHQIVIDQFSLYKKAEGHFGLSLAIKSRATKHPAEWWALYGNSSPLAQKFAIRILNLTCSAAGCERNWSFFEHIHSKKRNRLEHERLQNLVYVKYNRNLNERFKRKDLIDPISLEDIDDSNEWMTGAMERLGMENESDEDELVFENDTLTWDAVTRFSGVGERAHNTRQQQPKSKGKAKATTSTIRVSNVEIEEEEEVEFDEEEGNDGYNSNEEYEFDESDDGAPSSDGYMSD